MSCSSIPSKTWDSSITDLNTSSSSVRTSNRNDIFGLGASITDFDRTITGSRLPSGKQILRCMLFHTDLQLHAKRPGTTAAMPRSKAAKVVLEQIKTFYLKANIPMVSDQQACAKIVKLVDDNNKLRRTPKARRSGTTAVKQLEAMKQRLDASFPLWHQNADALIKDPEDIAFLNSMKADRAASFGTFDKKLKDKIMRRKERESQASARKEHEKQQSELTTSMCILEDSSDSAEEDEETTVSHSRKKIPRILKNKKSGTLAYIPPDILSRPNVVGLSARMKMTPAQQAAFTSCLIDESGGNSSLVSTSYATADRARRSVLESISNKCHQEWIPPDMCTLHWDGKLIPKLQNSRILEERLTVVVGDSSQLKLLGVPSYSKGSDKPTGTIIADLTYDLLKDWKCEDNIVNMAFDTTASNTGQLSAACIAIQLKLGRPLLWSACRHHVGEVIISNVFTDLKVEASCSPNIALFARLQTNWDLFPDDSTDPLLSFYTPRDDEPEFLSILRVNLKNRVNEMIEFKRGDYLEFANLCLVYLGSLDGDKVVKFRRPGALHKARWMAKLLYTIKLALLEHHISLLPVSTVTTRQQVPKIRNFVDFITHIYATWWFTCDKAVDAPWNDLQLYHTLQRYKVVHIEIASSALKAFERHMWYLTGEMIPLSLFCDKVPDMERRAIADAILLQKPLTQDQAPGPQLRFGAGFGKPKFPKLSPTTRLADLVNQDSWYMIHHLKIDPSFLPLAVDEWPSNSAFVDGAARIQTLNVVNDCAERGVKLSSDFVASARGELHLQNVLQAVEQNRSKKPNLRCSS